MNEIVPSSNTNVDSASMFNLIVQQADVLAKSRIIPRAYQGKPYDVIAAGLAGQSFGWDVMTSLRNYHVIEGTASLRPEAMLGLVRRAGHSVNVSVVARDDQRVAIAHGRRADNGDEHTAEFSTVHAKAAGLLTKNNWRQYEEAMLTWRAVSALCRVLFPDVVLGAGYVPEELGAIVTPTGEVVEEDPFAVRKVPAIEAKRTLLEACGGDKDVARAIWGERGSESMTSEELDSLVASVNVEDAEVVDAEVIETTAITEAPSPFEVIAEFTASTDDEGELVYDATGPVPFPKRAKLGSRATNPNNNTGEQES